MIICNFIYQSDGKFISIGEKIRLPDDVTLGYIVEHLLNKKLTVVDNFHSHLEPMKFIKMNSLADQVIEEKFDKISIEIYILFRSLLAIQDMVKTKTFFQLMMELT